MPAHQLVIAPAAKNKPHFLRWGFFICGVGVDENPCFGLTAMDGGNARNAGAIPSAADIDQNRINSILKHAEVLAFFYLRCRWSG
jgi:hypothetical protein